MNVALDFGKANFFHITIVYKVEAWVRHWSIDNGCGIAPKNFVEFLLKDYGF
jgi:hypothetical protein